MILPAFIAATLAWSFSWIAIKIQSNSVVPLELSVLYRLALTSIILFTLCVINKKRLILTKSEILFFIFIGFFIFCVNYMSIYHAVKYISSGVVATIFSLTVIISEIFSSFAYKRKVVRKTIISGFVGFMGLIFFTLPIINFHQSADAISVITGLLLALLTAFSYSVGNVLVGMNQKKNATPLYTQIAYSTAFGAMCLFIIVLFKHEKFIFDYSAKYVLSMIYIVLIASVLAFICLFYLVQKIGAVSANYTSLIIPVIALTVSSYFENYKFSFYGILGITLIMLALAIQFMKVKKYKEFAKDV